MEPWERVRVDAETYAEDVHSYINCTECHLGQAVNDMELAHEGMVDSPTEDAARTCGKCHETITEAAENSLHNTLAGYDTTVYERSIPADHPKVEEAQQYHCNECHATCGDCHISQPSNVGGGLLDGHQFVREPSMSQNCTACHGSRVKDEYYGAHEGFSSDVHFRARMSCTDCHTGDEMHGIGMNPADVTHRYDGQAEPSCESCHEDQIGKGSGIYQHEVHGTETMSCQTCHSVSYTNCTNCHVEQSDTGVPFFSVESHELDFMIAHNELRSVDRPYDWTVVRHVPIDRESFSFYGLILEQFDERTTWAYATPHNIQRNTPQTESCNSCHGNDDIFLTRENVVEDEWIANASIMVEAAPPLPEGYEDVITGQESAPAAAESDSSGGDDFWGGGGTSDEGDDADESGDFWGGGDTSDEGDDASSSDDFWGGGDTSDEGDDADESGDFWGGGDTSDDDADANENDPAADDESDAESFWGG